MTTISKTEHRDVDASGKPGRDCPLCPRLKAFREEWRQREPGWFNAPVASFGPRGARLLIVGLAPGLRGANRTIATCRNSCSVRRRRSRRAPARPSMTPTISKTERCDPRRVPARG